MDNSADQTLLSGAVLEVAPRLLGAVLTHTCADGMVAVRLTEVEAYDGANDPASHAWRGRTPRTEVMFGPAGRLYVYRSHGLHWCANIVTGVEGAASAVLLRAGEVVDGVELARARRGSRFVARDLARGPGRLCQALGLNADHGGANLLAGGVVRLALAADPRRGVVRSGPRVGVSRAAARPWRFWLDGEPSVSPYRASSRRKDDLC